WRSAGDLTRKNFNPTQTQASKTAACQLHTRSHAAPLDDAMTKGLISAFISRLLFWLSWALLPSFCLPARARPSARGLRSNPLRSDRQSRPDARPSPQPSLRRPVRSDG